MKSRRLLPLVILAATSVVGCDPDPADAGADANIFLRPLGGSGVWLNTSSIGSKEFSEFDLNGQLHAGVRLNKVLLKQPDDSFIPATASEVVDGELRVRIGVTVYTGAALIGSRWLISIPDYDYNYDDGIEGNSEDNGVRNVELWISAVQQDAPDQAQYTFKTLDEQGQPTFICDADLDGRHASIPIKDISVDSATGSMTSRASTVYLACTSGAVGKAVQWGYKPWEHTLEEFELASRMVRADYCFDGVSWTETGTHLQIRDAYDINDFLRAQDPTEVVWTTDGVACLGQPRYALYTAPQVTCGGQPLPTCPADVTLATYPGAVFWTKVDAQQ